MKKAVKIIKNIENKKINYGGLNVDFLCSVFGEFESDIRNISLECGDLPHCLFGNFFNPLLAKMLKSPDYSENPAVGKIFAFYERLAEYGDNEVKNLLQVTLLEYLWDDFTVYTRANKFMGEHTRKINNEIEKYMCFPQN
ncbi:MAG: hypothetical protein NC253_09395 [Ruminococcus sp.]|nr:hypothetical protein [Ruminococcus sp.]MCM1380863.1 hypothetical protein [Muribaculaceae bacterium]MCM1480729.1 hypothetical protein [Muribaculaceae bacterium]